MDIIQEFDGLKGWLSYDLAYSDGSSGIEQFAFKDFWSLRYYLGETFKKELKEKLDYTDSTLVEIHFQDKNNEFHVEMREDVFMGCCHNKIDSDSIDKIYVEQLKTISNNIQQAKDILEDTNNSIIGQ